MCCLGCVGLLAPRLVLLFLWIFTGAVDRAFSTFMWPLLGIVFLPFTTLFYVLVYSAPLHGPSQAGWVVVLAGFVLDLLSYASGHRGRHWRRLRRRFA